MTVKITYMRRCDECRDPYKHVKDAPTGWCEECIRRIHDLATAPPPEHHHFALPPTIEVFEK